MSEEQMIRHCAPTLAGIKTGSLFACPCADARAVSNFARAMNRRLPARGCAYCRCARRAGADCCTYIGRSVCRRI